MKLYVQLMIIFSISLIGEGISYLFHLPIPGSIIGLILLFSALQFKIFRLRHVSMVGNFLLANMTILFLPPAVGIMDKFHVIAPYLLPIVLIIVGAIVILSLIHISEPTRLGMISYAVFCLKKKKYL